MGYTDTNVGYASHVRVFEPLRKHNIADIIAAKFMDKAFEVGIDDACMTGKVSFPIKRDKAFKKGKYYDFIGINYYSRSMVSGINISELYGFIGVCTYYILHKVRIS